jgi:minor extracellular serine protease Vpr
MRRLRASLVLAAGAVLVMASVAGASAPLRAGQNADATYTRATVDTSAALVQLNGDPLSTYVKTKPDKGKKIDFNSNTVKAYRAQLSALRNDFKQWLRANAPAAKVTGSWDLALNAVAVQLNGTSLSLLRTAPMVKHVEYEGLYHPLDNSDPDLSLISAQGAWAVGGGAANAGAGVKVAIVDTGIDISHPCFDDAGYARQTQLGDHSFTNNKVIVAKVFNNKTPSRGYTPEAIQEHGTHVAGTVACNLDTLATVNGVSIPYAMSGVAPAALLGNYNVFPGDVTNARSEDILNALEAAYSDGMDVANMSLGGGASGIQDLLTMAVDDLDQANMVVAVAAGNSGPGHRTVESPGSAARALTAGASSVGHFVGQPFTYPSGGGTTIGAAIGDFPALAGASYDLFDTNATSCTSIAAGASGKLVIVNRGSCTFSTKVRNALAAGALGVVVVNNVAGDPVAMAKDGLGGDNLPAVMIGRAEGAALRTAAPTTADASASFQYFLTGNDDIMAGFSSQGPTDVDFRVKPDVVAPGVNVLSSIPHEFCETAPCFAFFQGTSMATPHLAGSAAVVKSQHPTWDAWQIRSAIVNTADQGVLTSFSNGTTLVSDPNIIGAGRENLLAAVDAQVALDPVSVSFGAVPSGSGQTLTAPVTVTNLSGTGKTFSFSVGSSSGTGVAYSVTPSITLGAGASGTIWITMAAAKGASFGDHFATLSVSVASTQVAHAVVYTLIK